MTEAEQERARAVEEQAAIVWTLRSKARVGSYQHEVSSGPWMELAGAEKYLQSLLAGDHLKGAE